MSSGARCSECGAVLPEGGPTGLCPKCLLGLGLEKVQEQSGGTSSAPSDIELAHSEKLGVLSPALSSKGGEGEAAGPGSSGRGAPPPAERPGDKIGRYKLLEQIGQGGFGVVYMAEQKEPVKRRVALKIIKLGMDTRQVVARFEAERQALALMDHPNIAKILEAGATETGRPYFVMELVHGLKVTDYCDQNDLSTPERLDLFVQICRAVQHAHQKGIIHRDLKPSNILVTLHDGIPVPKIIDFGIAKATQQELTEHTVFTQFGHFIGTPAYMSPEQAQLSGLDVDTRSDIYSLGVLLYELLTGRTPFEVKELLGAGLEEMRRMIREKEPVRPSTRLSTMLAGELTTTAQHRRVEPPKLVKLLRGDLDWIVMKCLEKDRARRYETANGLARDIERHLNDEPVVARPPSTLYRFRKLVRRNRLAFGAAAFISAALVLAGATITWDAVRARRDARTQSRLRLEAEQARQDATAKLWSSYLAEAQARRRSGEAGQRLASLAALSNAAAIRPSLELRNEAIACMGLADLRLVAEKHFKSGEEFCSAEGEQERYAVNRHGVVSIHRVSDDKELFRLPALATSPRYEPWFSSDGQLLGIRYSDGQFRVWDLRSSRFVLEAPMGRTLWPELSPDSRTLAMQQSTDVISYGLAGGQRLKTLAQNLPLPADGSWLLRFNPQGRMLAIGGGTNVLIVNLESGKVLWTLPHADAVTGLAWHTDGRNLASGCSDHLIYIWDAIIGQRLRTLRGHANVPNSLAFGSVGNLLASHGWDGKLRLWDFRSGRQLVELEGGGSMRFSSDGLRLVCAHPGVSGLSFFEVAPGLEVRVLHEAEQGGATYDEGLAFSTKGQFLAAAVYGGVKIWAVATGREVANITEADSRSVFFDEQDEHLFVSSGGTLKRRPLSALLTEHETGGEPSAFDTAPGGVIRACRSADGKILAALGSGSCHVFQADNFTERLQINAPGARYVALNSDGTLVATGAWKATGVKIWDAKTGRLERDLPTGGSANVLFSPNGHQLVTSTGSEYRFWEIGSWSSGLRLGGPPGEMAFSCDGRLFAGTQSKNFVGLFDPTSGRELASLGPPGDWEVTALAFTPDGTRLAECDSGAEVRVWDLKAIREQLAKMGLDWDMPPYPPKASSMAVER